MSVSDSHDEANIQDAAMAWLLKVLPTKLASGDHRAVGSEIFWQLRVETMVSALRPLSRVFSKNL
jgi:hypothetical protein